MDIKERKAVGRKLFHLTAGTGIAVLIYYNILNYIILLALTITLIAASMLSRKRKIPFFSYMFNRFGKEEEKDWPGKDAVTFLLGITAATVIFPKDIASASIIILSIGDPIAFFIGKYHGKVRHPLGRKTIEGTLAGIITSFIAATLFIEPIQAAIAATAGMASEAVSERYDNLTIPLSSGIALWLIRNII